MEDETTVTIAASPEAVWAVLTDVESMPELTESMTSVEKLDPGPLRVGTRVRIRQPKFPPAVWTVTEYVDNQRFVWEATGPGVRTTGTHEVAPADGGSRLRLHIDQAGPVGSLIGWVYRGLTRRYIGMEAAGIKRRAEEAG